MIFLHVVIHIVHSIVQVIPDDPALYSKGIPEFIKLPSLESHSSPEELECQTLAYYACRHLKTSKISMTKRQLEPSISAFHIDSGDFDAFLVWDWCGPVRHEINKSLPLSRLNILIRSVTGCWAQKLPNYLWSSRTVGFQQGLRVGEEPFLITDGLDVAEIIWFWDRGRWADRVSSWYQILLWNCPLHFKNFCESFFVG